MNDIDPELYNELNKAWKATCHIVLGDEVGELKDFEPWLFEFPLALRKEKSALSGKEVFLASDDYCHDAGFIGFDEIDFNKRFEPLNINAIKDIDSIVEALNERFQYTGNTILGNSKFVEDSTIIGDSFYVHRSSQIDNSQYVAYSSVVRYSKNVFGVNAASFSNYIIRSSSGPKNQRGFEYFSAADCSDIYFSANMNGCNECLFCFNLSGKRRAIGNLELQPDQYIELKKKLVSEMAADLKCKKRLPSLLDIISQFPRQRPDVNTTPDAQFDIGPIDAAFRDTFKVLLRKEPGHINQYTKYLEEHVAGLNQIRTDTSSHDNLPVASHFKQIKKAWGRLISHKEATALSNVGPILDETEVKKLSLHDPSVLSKIAFFAFDTVSGKNNNIKDCTFYGNTSNCYNGVGLLESKSCAYSFWPRESQNVFGSHMALSSSFCIKAYFSKALTRAFEVDNCSSCSDLYYSHNCENVHDSMFCFNVKNMNHAIGNAALPKDRYVNAKEALLGQIADELIKNKDLKWDIYNIGCYRK